MSTFFRTQKKQNKRTCVAFLYLVTISFTHWERPWYWERLKARGEGGKRGWDGWMASSTQWTWVWADSGSWWRTGTSSVLQSMGSQRVRHDRVTDWTELWRADFIGKDPDAGKDWGQEEKGGKRGRDSWMASSTQWTWVWANTPGDSGVWCAAVHGVAKSWTRLSNWTTTLWRQTNVLLRMTEPTIWNESHSFTLCLTLI